MVLFLIGLGLGDEKDVTVNGLEAIKKSKRVFLEVHVQAGLVHACAHTHAQYAHSTRTQAHKPSHEPSHAGPNGVLKSP